MKKIILILLIVTVKISSIFAAPIVFADANLKTALLNANTSNSIASNSLGPCTINLNGDLEIDSYEASLITGLDISSMNISNLGGLEAFTILEHLNCDNNNLTDIIPLSSITTLYAFSCNHNNITDISPIYNNTGIIQLHFEYNHVGSLNAGFISGIQGTSVGILGAHNNITSALNCGIYFIAYLDLSYNLLTNIDLNSFSNNLFGVKILSHNLLTDIQLPTGVVPSASYSGTLDLSYNQLQQFDISSIPDPFVTFQLGHNNLVSLNLKNATNNYGPTSFVDFGGNPNLQFICVDHMEAASFQTEANSFGLTNCFISEFCSQTPNVVNGHTKYDVNNNGCDATDPVVSNLPLITTNGITTIHNTTNSNGDYSIKLPNGSFTISPSVNTSYFTATPSITNLFFPATINPSINDVCISANGIFNDLEVTLIPIIPARPGFLAQYELIYKNKGTSIQSGNVTLQYNAAKFSAVAASPYQSSSTSTQLTWNFSSLMPLESRAILLDLTLQVPPINNIGNILNFNANVSSVLTDLTPTDNQFILNQNIVGSYDPNDKTCLEGTKIFTSQVGNFVNYLIRFENTGTYPAQNIVVRDLIDLSKFDITTLEPISGSHSFVTEITNGNLVAFVFQNIWLDFNAGNNDGYIAFKIKTLPTLVEGQTFSNQADIYFDFNLPIFTNIASTLIRAPFALPITLINFRSKKLPSNQIQLDWETANEINFKEFDIERSTDGIHFDKIGLVESNAKHDYSFIDVKPNSKNYYRLKLVDLDGQFDYSKVEIIELQHENEITLYPNPASSELTLSFPSSSTTYKTEISIKNTMGQEVLHQNIQPNTLQHKINVQSLSNGIYFIELKNKQGNSVLKFNKQ